MPDDVFLQETFFFEHPLAVLRMQPKADVLYLMAEMAEMVDAFQFLGVVDIVIAPDFVRLRPGGFFPAYPAESPFFLKEPPFDLMPFLWLSRFLVELINAQIPDC